MSRSYEHISEYKKEILEMKSKGMTLKEIREKYGIYSYSQMSPPLRRREPLQNFSGSDNFPLKA